MKNVDHHGCLTKKKCQLKSPAMARTSFDIRMGKWVSFRYRGYLRITNLSFEILKLAEGFGV